jgi:hypothetical protein
LCRLLISFICYSGGLDVFECCFATLGASVSQFSQKNNVPLRDRFRRRFQAFQRVFWQGRTAITKPFLPTHFHPTRRHFSTDPA